MRFLPQGSGKVEDALHDKLKEQAQKELRQETGYRAGSIEKILDFHSHPGYVSHHVHAFVASDLEWNPLPIEAHEAIRVRTYTLQEALTETFKDNRCDPEAALVLWLYAQKRGKGRV
jgi:ADP-ribose pyrophosphatase